MSVSLRVIIRDGLQSDIASCMLLDHTYETDYVWQVFIERDEPNGYQTSFKRERLPRSLDGVYPADERRLRLAIPEEHCFLIAEEQESGDILGYTVLRQEPAHRLALLQDLVVDRPYRRNHIGARLLNIARRWGREHELARLLAEIHTQNYPGIAFCQASGLAFCGYNERYFGNQDVAVFFGQTLR
jgi:GNAT superfamily N-acetyltransferase